MSFLGVLGAALPGFAGNVIDTIIGEKENDQARADSHQFQQSAENLQREFAQQGVRWRVEDAKAAGVHPLVALGAQLPSASPSFQVVGGGNSPRFGEAGQNISRAIASTQTQQERELSQLQIANAKLDLEGKAIDNQIRLKQLSNFSGSSTQAGPAMAGSDNFIPGQGNSPLVKQVSAVRVNSAPGRPAQEAGWVPDVGYARTDTGLTPVPSKDVKERIEDQFVPELMWALRNQLVPNFSDSSKPPKSMLPPGYTNWSWSYLKQEWQPSRSRSRLFGNSFLNK